MNTHAYVLGVNLGSHDASAALLKNGQLVAFMEEERISRVKNALDLAPVNAIAFCLQRENIAIDDLKAIAYGTDFDLLYEWHGYTDEECRRLTRIDDTDRVFPREKFSYKNLPTIFQVNHHIAHAASALWVSGFKEAAILVADNRGENRSTFLGYGDQASIHELESIEVAKSLGLFYRAAAEYAGLYGKYREAGKFMGLASYGTPSEIIPLSYKDGTIEFDGIADVPTSVRGLDLPKYRQNQLMDFFRTHVFPYTKGTGEDIFSYFSFAASVQAALEQVLLGLCQTLKERTNKKHLVLAGGVALNCTANGKIARSELFDDIFVQPVAHDAGVAIGAALYVDKIHLQHDHPPFVMNHAFLGADFNAEAIKALLDKFELDYLSANESDFLEIVTDHLIEEKAVGWFQGKSEVGPRALGARSIIASPLSRKMLMKVNKIKDREIWRPLSPSVLEEYFDAYFKFPHRSPFMIVANEVRDEVKHKIPAVVHVDNSARPQSVTKWDNPIYWKLIHRFYERTGVPVLLNTSFNERRKPIVHTPENAIECFLRSELSILAIANFIVFDKTAR